jgi:hypothetical protein
VKRHEIDPISLVFGLMFAASGALFMSANFDFSDVRGEWVWPIPLVLIGIALLVSALARRDDGTAIGEPEPEPFEEGSRVTSESQRDETL